jgi:hypothetical protein
MGEPVRHRQTKGAETDMFEPKATASHLDSTQSGSHRRSAGCPLLRAKRTPNLRTTSFVLTHRDRLVTAQPLTSLRFGRHRQQDHPVAGRIRHRAVRRRRDTLGSHRRVCPLVRFTVTMVGRVAASSAFIAPAPTRRPGEGIL